MVTQRRLAVVAVIGCIALPASLLHFPVAWARGKKAPLASVKFIPPLNGVETEGNAINDRGECVGRLTDRRGVLLPFVVRGKGIEVLPLPKGSSKGVANAINENGVIAGTQLERMAYGLRWRKGAKVESLMAGGRTVWAKTVSRNGTVAGHTVELKPLDFNNRPSAIALGVLWKGTGEGEVRKDFAPAAGNQEGTLVGEAFVGGSVQPAILKNKKLLLLPALENTERTMPLAISNKEMAVGMAIVKVNQRHPVYRPVYWTNGKAVSLPVPGGRRGRAFGVNNQGIIVGMIEAADGADHAAAWKNGKVTDLNTLIDKGSGWTLLAANGINNKGQIVGTGFKQNRHIAFVLDFK